MAETLKLVTWNLWFGEFERERRLAAALEIVEAEQADVLTFQEIVPETLVRLRDTPWIRDGYYLSDGTGATLDRYGTVVLTRRKPVMFHILELPSRMGRKLIAADVMVGSVRLRVGGMHLESLESVQTRRTQLGQIFPFLGEADAAVLMGDMNFDDGDPETADVPEHFRDLWRDLYPGLRGATRDSERNTLAAEVAAGPVNRRLDRIFVSAGDLGWRAEDIRILGAEELTDASGVYPSDHFGLAATVRLESGPE